MGVDRVGCRGEAAFEEALCFLGAPGTQGGFAQQQIERGVGARRDEPPRVNALTSHPSTRPRRRRGGPARSHSDIEPRDA